MGSSHCANPRDSRDRDHQPTELELRVEKVRAALISLRERGLISNESVTVSMRFSSPDSQLMSSAVLANLIGHCSMDVEINLTGEHAG